MAQLFAFVVRLTLAMCKKACIYAASTPEIVIMAYRNVYNPRGSLRRQQWYAMRHCMRKGRWLFKNATRDAAGRNSEYYLREALSLVRAIGVAGHKAVF